MSEKIELENLDYRQGDVGLSKLGLTKLSKLPKGFRKVKPNDLDNKRIVLAYGEKTGHAHAIYELDKTELFVDDQNNMIINVLEQAYLKHGNLSGTSSDHGSIKLDQGLYFYVPQRQYNYWKDSEERVRD